MGRLASFWLSQALTVLSRNWNLNAIVVAVLLALLLPVKAFSGSPDTLSASDWSAIRQAYLKASNTEADDRFGYPVAVCGDTVVIGGSHEDSSATGINGNQNDNAATNSGAVYVFVRSGTNWELQAYIKASNADGDAVYNGDTFGYSLALCRDTLVVGAVGEDSGATGVNGDQNDNSTWDAGAAYVFVRSGTNWSQQAYLKASNPRYNSMFGQAVAISGDTVVVAATRESSNAVGVNGMQTSTNVWDSGAAYIFVRDGTNWSQQAYLKASNPEPYDFFGWSAAISGDTVVIGAFREDSSATGVNGDQGDNGAFESGAVYVFVRDGTNWMQQAYLKSSNTGAEDHFGWSVAISGDTIVVGTPREDSNATGVNGNESDETALESGAVYVFTRVHTNWIQQAYLKSSNTERGDLFGYSVAISGNLLVVGASSEDSGASGINGNQSNNTTPSSGAAYVFVRSGTTWSQQAYIKASNPDPDDQFGLAAAVSGGVVTVGAPYEGSNATGVNGNQTDNSLLRAGAAYVFSGFTVGPALTLASDPDGCVIRFAGDAGVSYQLQRASSFMGPWETIVTTNAPFCGVVEIRDAPRLHQAFYRILQP